MPPMEDFYIGGASVKRETFPAHLQDELPRCVDIALPAEGVFHNLVFVSIRKTYPMRAYKTMHGLWGMGQIMFTKYLIVMDDDVNIHDTSEVLFRLCANTDPQRDSIFTKGRRMSWTMHSLKSLWERSWELTPRASSWVKDSKDRGRR